MEETARPVTSFNEHFIDMLYEAAEHPKLWPTLFEEILLVLEDADDAGEAAVASGQELILLPDDGEALSPLGHAALPAAILPHFKRAFRLSRQLAELADLRDAALGVLERLPVGVVLVSGEGEVTVANAKAGAILDHSTDLFVRGGRLGLRGAREHAALRHAIERMAADGGVGAVPASATVTVKGGAGGHTLSIVVVPAKHVAPTAIFSQGSAGVFLYSADIFQDVSESFLGRFFDLTPAEARLTKLLVRGKSVDEAADALGVTYATARSQLKSVYAKTDTHRQAELVHRVVTSPATLLNPGENAVPRLAQPRTRASRAKSAEREDVVVLRDGRRIGYAEYGDPAGRPVLFFHAILNCRLTGATLGLRHADARRCRGVRLICLERPGYGWSDPQRGRKLRDWVDDVRQVADAFDIDRFGVLGASVGGLYALSCAHDLPDRVSQVGVVSTLGPTTSIKALRHMTPMSRAMVLMARYSPALAGLAVRRMVRGLLAKPEQFLDAYLDQAPPSEHLLVTDPVVRQRSMVEIGEAFRNGSDGMHSDVVIAAYPWGFDHRSIMQPVHIWQGDADHHVPLALAQPLFEIPASRVHRYPGAGHMLLFQHWDDIIVPFATPPSGV